MPIAEIAAQDALNLAALMSPDLAAELRRQQVSEPLLATLSKAGFRTVRKFQMIVHSEQNLEEVAGMFGLDRKVMEDFSDICSLKAAWASVRVYQQKEDAVRAETKLLGMINPMKPSDYTATRMAYERLHGKQESHKLPGPGIIDAMEAHLEEGWVKPPRLHELPSREEADKALDGKTDTNGFSMTWAASGVNVTQPVKVKQAPPRNTEEFRERMQLLCTAISYLQIGHPTNAIWESSSEAVWAAHVEYFFGHKVRGKEVKDTKGVVRKTPSWDLVMLYEQAVRDKAAELMNEGTTANGSRYDIAADLKAARECSETRTWEFIEKFQMEPAGSSKDRDTPRPDKTLVRTKRSRSREVIQPKKKVKGAGKQTKGAPPANNQALHPKQLGNPIRFKYNRKSVCTRTSCSMAHVCQVCLGKHSMETCPDKA